MTDEASVDNAQSDVTKGKRDRSPSHPFISLKEAVERIKKFAGQYKHHQARFQNAVTAWGYASKSSGGIQTVSALKAFGLLKVQGSGNDRKVQLTPLAWRILEANQESTRREAILESALKPSIISECWSKWGAERPPDAECLDHLTFERNFNKESAKRFLKIYDDTISYGNLTKTDISPMGEGQSSGSGTATDEKPPKQERRHRIVEKGQGQWIKGFVWPLSEGTTAEFVIDGVPPGMDEIEILEGNFNLAMKVLKNIVKQPTKDEPENEAPLA